MRLVSNLGNTAQNARVDLAAPGPPAVPLGPVTVLMGPGKNPDVTAENQHDYPVSTLEPYCTRALYLGNMPAKCEPLVYYESTC